MQTAGPWRTVEIAVESSRSYSNPYRDVNVEAIFSGPGGMQLVRPAYWDGGSTWRVRFAPTQPGRWHYRIASDQQADEGLSGITGELECVEEASSLAIYRHGFLRKEPGGRHLAHADGTPFFWLGDTHWRFAWESWDESNKPGWTSQFRGMVDKRAAQGFTIYQCNLMSFAATSPCWMPGKEYQMVDVTYFQTVVEPRMAYIAEHGLVNALGLGWFMAVDADTAGLARFARYIVARYGSYPMVWTLGGEVAGYDPALRQQRVDSWRQVALSIRDADGYNQPARRT